MSRISHVAVHLSHARPVLLTAPRREQPVLDLLEDTEERVVLHEVEVEEEAAGAQVEEAVEDLGEKLLEAEEEAAAEEEAVEKLQVEEEAVVGEKGAKAASPAHHPPIPSLAALVKAQVRTGRKEYLLCPSVNSSL